MSKRNSKATLKQHYCFCEQARGLLLSMPLVRTFYSYNRFAALTKLSGSKMLLPVQIKFMRSYSLTVLSEFPIVVSILT